MKIRPSFAVAFPARGGSNFGQASEGQGTLLQASSSPAMAAGSDGGITAAGGEGGEGGAEEALPGRAVGIDLVSAA